MASGVPTTVGAVDVGASAVRMVIAQVSPTGEIEVLERVQRAVRLGHSTFVSGRLSRQAINATIAVLRDYRRLLDTYRVERVRSVATSAVREAANADTFLDRAAMAVNLDIEVIERAEESRLLVSAVRHAVGSALGLGRRRALIVEVGSGSALLTVLRGGALTASESFPIGAIRIQELLHTYDEPPARAAELLRHHIANAVASARRALALGEVDLMVAVGGDARFAAQRVGRAAPFGQGLHIVAEDDLSHLVEECVQRTPEELARAYALAPDAAETLVPALLVYQAILGAVKAREMIVAGVSIRDGLLLELARQVTGQEDAEGAQGTLRAARALAKKYRADAHHGALVAELAVRLFNELQPEHGLRPRFRLLLQVAAILHEVGRFVSSAAHHKHSYYLISNSEVFGLRRQELSIAAHVARYHRRAGPGPTHLDYMSLPRESRLVVNKLAAILRVADALARRPESQGIEIQVQRRGDEVVLSVPGITDLSLERRALAAKADLFEDTYGLSVRVEEARAPEG